MPLDNVANLELVGGLVAVRVLKRNLHDALVVDVADVDEVGTGMVIRAVSDKLTQLFDVVAVGAFWIGQDLGHESGHDDFINSAVGVWGDNCAACKVDALAGEVLAEAAVLSFEALIERSDRFVAQQINWQSGSLAVEILRDGPLHHIPILDELVCCITALNCLSYLLVKEDDFAEFYRQIVFILDCLADGDRRSNAQWWHG